MGVNVAFCIGRGRRGWALVIRLRFFWAGVALALFWDGVVFINALSLEGLPGGESWLENLRLKPLIGERERDIFAPALAFGADTSSGLANELEALGGFIFGDFATHPDKNLWFEVEHVDALRAQTFLPEIVHLLHSHVLRVRPVVVNMELSPLVTIAVKAIVRILMVNLVHQVALIIVTDELLPVVDDE